jgi:hypothetical protein
MLRVPLAQGKDLVYLPLTRRSLILPVELVKRVQSCTAFLSIDEQCRRLCSDFALPPERVEQLRQELLTGIENGLLVSAAEFIRDASEPDAEAAAAPRISSICIPTKDRTTQLRRALASYIANARQSGRDPDFVVTDDSSTPASRQECRSMLVELGREYGARLYYAGPPEKAAYASALAKEADLPDELLNFALLGDERCGTSHGANRNALLLHTAGEMLLSFDDDSVCETVSTGKGGLQLAAHVDPARIEWFANREAAFSSANVQSIDLLAEHEVLLGRRLGDAVQHFSQNGDLVCEQMCEHIQRSLFLGTGRIISTYNGLIGDCGQQLPFNPVYLVRRGIRQESDYRDATTCREMVRGVSRTTIWHGIGWMNFASGLDNREPLPPYLPVERGEDSMFMTLVRKCFKEGFFGFLPWAILHDPTAGRTYGSRNPHRPRLCEIVGSCIASCSAPTRTPETTMKAVGSRLLEIATLQADDFDEVIRGLLWHSATQTAAQLEEGLRGSAGQPHLVEALQTQLDLLKQAVVSRDYALPYEFKKMGHDDGLRFTREILLKIGNLLTVWPNIVAAAITLKNQGRRLAQPADAEFKQQPFIEP